MPRNSLLEYYAHRAMEYDEIYSKPERQKDLTRLKAVVRDFCTGEHVLELAAGTGYWTEVAAEGALSVHCTDANPVVLERARQRLGSRVNVTFADLDANNLSPVDRRFTVVLCGFWWSHISRPNIDGFLHGLKKAVPRETKALVFDNRYVPGSSTPISLTDSSNNTYQRRVLADGSEYTILKNFPSERELLKHASAVGHDIRIDAVTYYWWMRFQLL